MTTGTMHVHLRLPDGLLHQGRAAKVFAHAENGAFGLLPRHADFLAALVPSVLVVTEESGRELFFGIDRGLLVKRDAQVEIVVRRAVQGDDLATLAQTIETRFQQIREHERAARTALSRLEAGMVRNLRQMQSR